MDNNNQQLPEVSFPMIFELARNTADANASMIPIQCFILVCSFKKATDRKIVSTGNNEINGKTIYAEPLRNASNKIILSAYPSRPAVMPKKSEHLSI